MTIRNGLVRFAARNWPFPNGSGRFIEMFGKGIEYGENIQTFHTTDGFDIDVLPGDLIGRHIAISGLFDRGPIAALLDFCEPGDHFADIGANIGYVACVLLQRVPGSKILCIEPQPEVVPILRGNLSRFPADRWTLLQAALSDAETEGFLSLNSRNRGASRLVTEQSETTVAVPMLPAHQVLGGLDRLDIIKMDIEGHEETVFRSGVGELKRLQPRAILFEDQKGLSTNEGPIGQLLAQAGYRVFGIRKGLFGTSFERVTSENSKSFNDFMAVSTSRKLPPKAVAKYKL